MDTMQLSEVWRYPVKSMAGGTLEHTVIGPLGIPGDRELVVVDESGRIQDARARHLLLRHRATMAPDGRVRIDGRDWEDREVARWVRAAAGTGARLQRWESPERFDVLPLLVITDGAIEALGVDYRRLRPNLVIGGVKGLAERDWENRYLMIGDAVVGLANLRERCIITTWDPETGVQDVGVLHTIRSEFGGTFALNAWAARPGVIRVGDRVALRDAFDKAAAPQWGRYASR